MKFILTFVILLVVISPAWSGFPMMKTVIKNQFDRNNNNFWSESEITHLREDSMNLFSCFVEKKGYCQYYQPDKLPSDCNGFDISDNTIVFKSEVDNVVITGNKIEYIDASSIEQETIPKTTTLKIMAASKLASISPDFFSKFPNLQEVIIYKTAITSVPNITSPLTELVSLTLVRNSITRVNDYDFTQMPGLTRLNLACNQIDHVSDKAFVGLASLVKLSLGTNIMSYVPPALFKTAKSLQYIGMESNKLEVVAALTFSEMESLIHINLTNNSISKIEPRWIAGSNKVKFIELSYNHLETLDPFSFNGTTSLLYVSVSQNDNLHLIKGRALNDLESLKVLDLSRNKVLSKIDYRAFSKLTSLKYLDLSQNTLTTFPHSVFIFARFSALTKLWLQNNKIADLASFTSASFNEITGILETRFEDTFSLSESFKQMELLDYLDLSGNLLSVIPNHIMDCLKIETENPISILDLSNNKIETVERYAFLDMRLSTLYLNANYLKEVPKALFEVAYLDTIKLNSNLLTYLEEGTLTDLTMAKNLDLSDNQILAIEDEALPRSLEYINLADNQFDFVDEAQFNNMPNLIQIDFTNNRVSYLPRDVFTGNTKLTHIYLNNNGIHWLDEGVFTTCSEVINELVMEDNDLAYVEHGVLANKRIIKLEMQNNDLHDWPKDDSLSSQDDLFFADFKNNRFEVIRTGMFNDHSQFQKVDFEENCISDVEQYAFYNLNVSYTKADKAIFGVNLIKNPVSNLEPFSFTDITSLTPGEDLVNHAGLHLEEIDTLGTLQSNTFTNVKMDYIFLNNGGMQLIETHAFNNIYLHRTLQFNECPLKYVAKRAVNAQYIRYIQFNQNKIRKLPLGAFEEIQGCDNFNIDHNEINFIDTDSLPNCTDKFNFQDNQITHIVVDAFRKATSIQNLQFTNNRIIKIESGALDTVSGTLDTFLLGNNPLPEVPDNLLNGAKLELLNLGSNNIIRTVGVQELGSYVKPGTINMAGGSKAYIHESVYSSIKKGLKGVDVYGVAECTCNLMRAMQNLHERNTKNINVNGPAKCAYVQVSNGADKTETVALTSYNALQGKLQCEPFVTRTVRTSISFTDQLPTSERVEVYWQLPDTVVWGEPGEVYCCSDNTGGGCVGEVRVEVACEREDQEGTTDTVDTGLAPFLVSLSTGDPCDQEFSKQFDVPYSTSDFIFCSLRIEIAGRSEKYSALGPWRVGHQEQLQTSEPASCVGDTLSLAATFYDLTNDFEDFQNMGYDKMFRGPQLYSSPNLGPYLYQTDRLSSADTITQWFTPNDHVLHTAQEDLCLTPCEGFEEAASYCTFYRQWWPVDGLVDTLQDTTGNFLRHNMYFTARLQMSAMFTGEEVLTVGGPDDVWVFFNGTLVLEVLVPEEDTAPLPCGELRFTGGVPSTQQGVLDMEMLGSYVDRCSEREPRDNLVSEGVLAVGDEMEVVVFTTMRRSLSSQLFLRMSNFERRSWSNFETFGMLERKVRDGKIGELDFRTVLGDSTYNVKITDTDSVNDNYEIHKDTFTWTPDPAAPVVNVSPGAGVPDHYNCIEAGEAVEPVEPEHEVEIDTPSALVILKNPVDYEAITSKHQYLYLETSYTNTETEATVITRIRLQIDVVDENDNCPVFNDAALMAIDRTTLCLDLRGTQLDVEDADDGMNKAIQYFIGGHEVTNLNATEYAKYRTVDDYFTYETFTVEYIVELYAVDGGAEVRLGTRHQYTVTISASCIQGMEFVVGTDTGVFNVRSPGWMVSSSNLAYCDTCTLGYRCMGFGSRVQCTTCTQSFTNTELDTMMFTTEGLPREEEGCEERSKWEISFGGQSSCSACKPGWQCLAGVGTPVQQLEREQDLEVGTHFINLCLDEQPDCVQEMLVCQEGYLCRAGVTAQCPAGQYSEAGSSKCSFCPPGEYSPNQGAASCTKCEGGMESTHGKESCDYCPENEVSAEGEMCRKCENDVECPCLKEDRPCSQGVQCVNLPGDSNKCLSCPDGFEEEDGVCVDIDECERFAPCYAELNVACINTVPGFKCDPCPSGYQGNAPEGIGKPATNQTCEDVDECGVENGGCDVNSVCHNKPGHFYCGYCYGQYVGNGTIPCKSGDYCITPETNNCHANAECHVTGPAGYSCECNIMYAGNGTACGLDSDGDGFPDSSLNCIGPSCLADNCVSLPNSDQADLDQDGLGDPCDTDIDDDLSINSKDYCPYDFDITSDKMNYKDKDNDGWLNACDNCPDDANVDQYDKDYNGVGDECEECQNEECFTDVLPPCDDNSGLDSDGDGVDDSCDNCVYVANSAQRDVDEDGVGDRCDEDIDADGTPNTADNCPYLANPGQENQDKDYKGDLCDDTSSWPDYMTNDADADGDEVPDITDICPFDKAVSSFSFSKSALLDLATLNTPSQIRWKVRSKGHDIDLESVMYEKGNSNSERPVVLLGETRFEEVQFDGTFYVHEDDLYPTIPNGQFGIVFGYQKFYMQGSTERYLLRFYLATWRHNYFTFSNCGTSQRNACNYGAITGLQIKSVTIDSTSNSSNRKESLWWSASQTNSATKITTNLIYQDPKHTIWDFNTAYRWRLHHHPSTGRIRMSIHQVVEEGGVDGVVTVVDTGDLFDKTNRGGQIGLYSFGQWNVTFANTAAKCSEPENYAASFNGQDSVLSLGPLGGLGVYRSFEISAWFKVWEAPGEAGWPLICKDKTTSTQTLCVSLTTDLKLRGEYAGFVIDSTDSVVLETWTYFVLRYDMQYKTLHLYHNIGAAKVIEASSEYVNTGPVSEVLYVGWDGENYYKGVVDEIRIFHRLIHEADYLYKLLFQPSLSRENRMRLVGAHLNCDRKELVDVLGNINVEELNADSSKLPSFVPSDVLSQMYRYDDVTLGDLEKKMFDDESRKRRETARTKKRGKSAETQHECNEKCSGSYHDEL